MVNFIKRLIRRGGTTPVDLSWQEQVQELLATQQGQIADLSKRIDVVRRQVYRTAERRKKKSQFFRLPAGGSLP